MPAQPPIPTSKAEERGGTPKKGGKAEAAETRAKGKEEKARTPKEAREAREAKASTTLT